MSNSFQYSIGSDASDRAPKQHHLRFFLSNVRLSKSSTAFCAFQSSECIKAEKAVNGVVMARVVRACASCRDWSSVEAEKSHCRHCQKSFQLALPSDSLFQKSKEFSSDDGSVGGGCKQA